MNPRDFKEVEQRHGRATALAVASLLDQGAPRQESEARLVLNALLTSRPTECAPPREGLPQPDVSDAPPVREAIARSAARLSEHLAASRPTGCAPPREGPPPILVCFSCRGQAGSSTIRHPRPVTSAELLAEAVAAQENLHPDYVRILSWQRFES